MPEAPEGRCATANKNNDDYIEHIVHRLDLECLKGAPQKKLHYFAISPENALRGI